MLSIGAGLVPTAVTYVSLCDCSLLVHVAPAGAVVEFLDRGATGEKLTGWKVFFMGASNSRGDLGATLGSTFGPDVSIGGGIIFSFRGGGG